MQEVPSSKEHISSVTHGQTDSGKCTTTGRLLFEENLGFENPDNEAEIILSKMLWRTVYISSFSAFDEHEANIGFGTFDEAVKFDADGKAHMQEDELTNFADEQDASIRAQMLGVGVRIKYRASEMPMEKRLQRVEENNLEDSSHPKII